MNGEHIFLGDFNLHHPLWTGPSYPRHHRLSDTLLEHMRNASAELLLPQGTITREMVKGGTAERTTIDLIFATTRLQRDLIQCDVVKELEQSSDHYPILTRFSLTNIIETPIIRQRYAWKRIDEEKFIYTLNNFQDGLNRESLAGKQQINIYVERLTQAIRTAIEASTPLIRIGPFTQSWWTQECRNIVKATRRARRKYNRTREEEDWKLYREMADRKGKILYKAKQEEFRQRMQEAGESQDGIWKIAKWAKNRAQGQ
jgi:hypothetical protein